MISQAKNLHQQIPLQYLMVPLFTGFLLLASPLLVWKLNSMEQRLQLDFRAAQVESRTVQRNLLLLSASPFAKIDMSDSNLSFDVALREATDVLKRKQGVKLDDFTVTESELIEVDDLVSPMTSVQVKFEATLHHAPALLDILSHLAEISGWRVMEVRACALQRLLAEPRLAAACSLEIHSWEWTENREREGE